jgi:hypothetical protein
MRRRQGAVVSVPSRLIPSTRALHFWIGTALHFWIGIHTRV